MYFSTKIILKNNCKYINMVLSDNKFAILEKFVFHVYDFFCKNIYLRNILLCFVNNYLKNKVIVEQ
jgi:hypothetical protein